jgi:RNA polymerase sigma-70 factor (ECF subfamily)
VVQREVPEQRGKVIDLQLVVAARAGTVGAFDVLVSRYEGQIFGYLMRLVGDRQLAEDLTQETFLAAYRALHQLSDEQSFAAWLYGIAFHHATPIFRRRRIARFTSLDSIVERVEEWMGRSKRDDPDDIAERDAIQAALDQLPDGQRVALLLHSLAGFTGREVAAIIGTSPDAATRQISRARQRFRELYRDPGDDAFRGRRIDRDQDNGDADG